MIKKKFKVTTITAQSVKVDNGETVVTNLPTVTTFANVTEKNVKKRYIEKHGENIDGMLFITSFKNETVVFEMSEEKFIENAIAVEV